MVAIPLPVIAGDDEPHKGQAQLHSIRKLEGIETPKSTSFSIPYNQPPEYGHTETTCQKVSQLPQQIDLQVIHGESAAL